MPLITFEKVIRILEIILGIISAMLKTFRGVEPEDPEIGS